MEQGQLIAVNGKIYEYSGQDKNLKLHFASEVEIDENGILTATYSPAAFTTEELTNNEINFTQNQWYGIVEHFLRQDYNFTEEAITDATEDIVGRCFAYGIPKLHELPNYIAIYMDR